MKIPTYDRFKNATFVLQKFTSLKNISKRTKLILLASAVSISVLTTGTVVFLSSSNSQNHSKHSYDIDKQNIPLAPSTKIATIELPERPLTSNNKKIIKSYDEQIKEIASIKSNHETVDKEISAQVQTQTNSAPSNFTASEHPQQTILPTTKDNFEAKQNLNNPREVTVTPASSSKELASSTTTDSQAPTMLAQEKPTTASDLPAVPLMAPPTQEAHSLSGQVSQKPILSQNSSLDTVLDITANQKIQPISKQEEISVLNLLTREATLIRNMNNKISTLEKQQQTLIDNNHAVEARMSGEIEDLKRRVSLQEASKAIASANEPTTAPKDTSVIATFPSEPVKLINYQVNSDISQKKQKRIKSLKKETHKKASKIPDYSIQAASPDIAMLIAANGNRLQINTNSEIPGYGRVKSISQKGTAWYIVTDKGIIQ